MLTIKKGGSVENGRFSSSLDNNVEEMLKKNCFFIKKPGHYCEPERKTLMFSNRE